MKKLAEKIIKYRFIITPIFILLTIITFSLMNDVNTNYDNSKYLPEDSLATKDTNEIRDAIDLPVSISLMVSDIEKTEIETIKAKLESLAEVDFVIIDPEDITNYKDGHALFTIFLESSCEDIGVVVSNVEDTLTDYDINLSGNHVNSYHQEEKVLQETPIIMIVACVVISIILLLTTQRYLEPLAFGIVIGIAIILNMGTNIIFPEISYVTKSVAAVLQLGLSMDYSIILINNYYHEKNSETNSKKAMVSALGNSFKPITSSSLTTIIGLVALLFMSFTIGKDIGLVLAKCIVISLISVFALLPNIILWLEKVPFNKKHRTLNISSLSVKSSSRKVSGGITAFAFIFIIGMFFVQGQNSYIFTDETKFEDEETIKEVFGESNTFVIGIPNNDNLYENEVSIMTKLNDKYESSIISYLGEINSTKKQVKYSDLLDLTNESNARLMLSLFALDSNIEKNMIYIEFISELETMISNDVVEPTPEMSDLLKVIQLKNIMNTEFTSEELLASGLLPASSSEEIINLVYSSYAFDNDGVLTDKISLDSLISTMLLVANDKPELITNTEELSNLQTLKTQLDNIELMLTSEVSPLEFQALAFNSFGVTLEQTQVEGIFAMYFQTNGITPTPKVNTKDILTFMVSAELLPAQQSQMISGVLAASNVVKQPIEYQDVNQNLNSVIYFLTGVQGTVDMNDSIIKLNYVVALDQAGAITVNKVELSSLVTYLSVLLQDPVISSMVTPELSSNLVVMQEQLQLLKSDSEYTYKTLPQLLSTTENEDLNKLVKVSFASSLSTDSFIDNYQVPVEDLLTYVTSHDLGLSPQELNSVNDLQNQLIKMQNAITSEKTSVIVLNTTLPYESQETRDFIKYVYNDVFDTVDEKASFIGYSVSDSEIKGYFEDDLLKINFITIGAVLLILIITFRSVIIPVLLVFTIEGAIWTTLSFSYVINEDIFFMCYIIIGAIQLGATIDYAIILTSNYQELRVAHNAVVALKEALRKSIPSIVTSGSILTIAGFAIAFVSTQASIVSIGTFLGRVTLISMIFVVTVLPSMLFTFDKLIIKAKKLKKVNL